MTALHKEQCIAKAVALLPFSSTQIGRYPSSAAAYRNAPSS